MFKEIFGFFMLVFVLFNSLYYIAYPNELNGITITNIAVLGANLILTGAILGVSALSVGLDSESIKIIVSGVGISLLLFAIPLGVNFGGTYYGFNIGLGLVSNIVGKMGSDLLGYPSLLVNTLGLITLLSGVMVVAGND